MAWKAAAPCDLWREHVLLNPGSFSTTANADDGSGDWRFTAVTAGTPTRLAHTSDQTAYSTQPVNDSWASRLRGWINRGSNTSGGNLT